MIKSLLQSAVAVAALSTGVAFAGDTVSHQVVGNVGDAISLSLDESKVETSISLAPGAQNKVVNGLLVSSTKAFTITAVADKAKMTEHTGSDYISDGSEKALATVPSIAATTAGDFQGAAINAQTLPGGTGATAAPIFNGSKAVQDGSVVTTITQPVAYTDTVLPSGRNYRIYVTYTAAMVTPET